jgi:hypothetical protein
LFSYPSIEEHIIAIQEQMKTYDIRAIATTKQKVDQKNKAKINTFVRKNVSSIKDVPLLPSFPR